MTDLELKSNIFFLEKVENLKSTLRSAYTTTGRRESTAEHCWRLALMALIFENEFSGLDHHRILKMCLVHDLGEAICGDIPAICQDADNPKADNERQAMEKLAATLQPQMRAELMNLWHEYENNQTPEAKVVKGLDKLETIIQHNQGLNPSGTIDYEFNLHYGQEYTSAHPLLKRLRTLVDEATKAKSAVG